MYPLFLRVMVLLLREGIFRFVCVFGCMATLSVVVAPVVLVGKSWSFQWARQGDNGHRYGYLFTLFLV